MERGAELLRVRGDLLLEPRPRLAPEGRHEGARLGERCFVDGELVRVEARAEGEESRLGRSRPFVGEEGARVLGPERERRAVERTPALRRGAREAREVPRREEHGREAARRGEPRDALAVFVLLPRGPRAGESERRVVPGVPRVVAKPHGDDGAGGGVPAHLGEVVRPERRPPRHEGERLQEVRLPLPVVSHDEVEARVQLHLAVQEVSEALGRERKNLHAADYILIGITT